MTASVATPVVLGLVLAASAGALVTVVASAVLLAVTVLVVQPGNPKFRDHAAIVAQQPYVVFWVISKLMRLANLYQQLKPAPLRVAEVTVAFIHSQVLFVILNLGIAEALREGPKTAQQLAAAAGPRTNAEWLSRVLKLAAELGLVKRSKVPGLHPQASKLQNGSSASSSIAAADTRDDLKSGRDQAKPEDSAHSNQASKAAYTTGYSCNDIYSANAVTAVLCRDHPNCMADFVKLFEDHYGPFEYLSEGILNDTTPFSMWPKAQGPDFWEHIKASSRHATTFDGAMRACNHTGARMAVEQYPWSKYDVVVDIGGGNGQFLAELLSRHSALQGVLVDQQGQVERGQKWWAAEFSELLPRMTFVVGDMFKPSTLPGPKPGQKTLIVLKQVLHDWSDADSLAILKSIRAVVTDEDIAAGRVSLAVLETGTMETVTRSLLQHRLEADVTMLMSFGDGKERDEAQSDVLLRAAGFKPGRLIATTGLMTIQEATPAPIEACAANGTAAVVDKHSKHA